MELVILALVPIILALPVYLLGRNNPAIAKWLSVLITGALSIYSIVLWIIHFVPEDRMTNAQDGFLLHFQVDWIPEIGATFALGVDGLSMPLVILTQVIFFLSVIAAFYLEKDEAVFHSMTLVLLTGVTLTFVALDLIIFYIAWELVLVPMYFLINSFGGPNRRYAAIKFFIYTGLASLLMLIGLFLIYLNGTMPDGSYTFYLPDLRVNLGANSPNMTTMVSIFWLLFIGFGTKFPVFPVHTWLPDAHVQAPSPGSSILAGLLLKMGGYGLLRMMFWLFTEIQFEVNGEMIDFYLTATGENLRLVMGVVAMISLAYPAFVALRQDDLKKMIAYSSISHMGIVLLGAASYTTWGFNGAMYMMIAHGVISPALFLLSGTIEHNTKNHTRLISKVGGLAHKMPFTGGLFVFMAFASAGLPGLAGFIAEFSGFIGAFSSELFGFGTVWVFIPVVSVLSIIVTTGYYLWAVQRVIFNEPTEELDETGPAKWYETLPVAIMSVFALVLGVIPTLIYWVLDEFTRTTILA